MNAMTMFFILFFVFVLSHSTDASRASRRHARAVARQAKYVKDCENAQGNHTAKILADEDLNIFSHDYVCYDNLKPLYQDICMTLEYFDIKNDDAKNNVIIENFKKYYLDKVYTAANFPLTYRKDRKIGDINIDTVNKYYVQKCYIRFHNGSIMLWIIIPFIIFVFSFCGEPPRRR